MLKYMLEKIYIFEKRKNIILIIINNNKINNFTI